MDRENITPESSLEIGDSSKNKNKPRVDINILLNRVRINEKKEKYEKFIFLGLVSLAIIVTGLVVSL